MLQLALSIESLVSLYSITIFVVSANSWFRHILMSLYFKHLNKKFIPKNELITFDIDIFKEISLLKFFFYIFSHVHITKSLKGVQN